MATLFDYAGALIKHHWDAATSEKAKQLPKTTTPLENLTQRSMVEIDSVPLILAQGNGSLIQDIAERNSVIMIGKMTYMNHDFFRCYLSQGEGAFLHLAVNRTDPNKVLECRLYQPYLEYIPVDPAITLKPGETATKAGQYEEMNAYGHLTGKDIPVDVGQVLPILPEGHKWWLPGDWDYWLRDHQDPQKGGVIGCPNLMSKPDDNVMYARSWGFTGQRVQPVTTQEFILDMLGQTTTTRHSMMHYGRKLKDDQQLEYMLVSAVETSDGASVCMWVGIDVLPSQLKIYPG